MKHPILFLLIFLFIGQHVVSQIAFNQTGHFKIVQFTDLHYSSNSSESQLTLQVMTHILEKENPELVVLTGDLVLGDDVEKGWHEVAAVMAKHKTNWVAVLGNHDSEGNISRHDIYRIIEKLPHNISCSSNLAKGITDFSLTVKSSTSSQVKALLYLFDSNDYAPSYLPGPYGWIKQEQVNWYRNESAQYTSLNGNNPLPALAFLHIPLKEYAELKGSSTVIGHWNEDVSSPQLNTGLMAAMVESRDMMGVFAGHDHNNDYIGVLNDIALGYGRCSGFGGYGDLRQGARVIELEEGKFQFRSWITTPTEKDYEFQYPADTSLTVQKPDYLPAITIKTPLKQGIAYNYYEGEVTSVQQIEKLKMKSTGIVSDISLSMASATDYFAVEYNGYLKIPVDDVYQFYLTSDDGAVLFIDGQKVVDNDGSHSAQTKFGSVALAMGYHRIKIQYIESYMGQYLEVGVKSSAVRNNELNNHWLFVE